MPKGEDPFNNDLLMRRDYQELYVRDLTINALCDVNTKRFGS